MSLHTIDIPESAAEYTIDVIEQCIEAAGGVRALSRAIGCSAAHITNIRLGNVIIGPKMVMALCKYLGEGYEPKDFRPDVF